MSEKAAIGAQLQIQNAVDSTVRSGQLSAIRRRSADLHCMHIYKSEKSAASCRYSGAKAIYSVKSSMRRARSITQTPVAIRR